MAAMYTPPAEVLAKYADVLINFALNSGQGVRPGEVVQCAIPDVATSLGLQLQNTILRAGAHPIIRLLPSGYERDFFQLANEQQLTFFPEEYYRARVQLIDHQVGIIADVDPEELKEVDPAKITRSRDSRDPYRRWLMQKEVDGKFTWTIALWGVPAKAKEVGLTLEQYWDQIIRACHLDKENPVAEWQQLTVFQDQIKAKLNALSMEWLTIKGADVDLRVKLGPERLWQGGSGRNIPSFEFFTSPDWRGTEGWIHFNQPLYRYGNVLRGISLRFAQGVVIEAHAKVGNHILQQLLKSHNADKIGEFSLTDKRMSRITHVMAETLFDENIGGPFGNTHLAIGMAYKDCYRGDASALTKADWERLGYNESPEHTDIISTTDRTVTATLSDGSQKVIYQNGQFTL